MNTWKLNEMRRFRAAYTLTNKYVWSKIDKAIINMEWCNMSDFIQAEFLNAGLSDHTFILLLFPQCLEGSSPFRVCDIWVADANFLELVSMAIAKSTTKNGLCYVELSLMRYKANCKSKEEAALRAKYMERKQASYVYSILNNKNVRVDGFEVVAEVMTDYYKQ
ncbi:hypothetical protein Cgig2_020481 [Carnegiea gigantea]|uniref:Uncharacterized protein n=1 Tax=Carnegiea gigantea TaxID=171969 RepID=A0A9Q1GKC2_9CARY|nr:hypothetical protein Cgig2_020481 [Carnegiea gigantea]